MMKRYYSQPFPALLAVMFLLSFVMGCKKDKKEELPSLTSEEVKSEAVSSLSKSTNLGFFTDALQNAELSDADVAEGLTILAVPDDALQADNPSQAQSHLQAQKMAIPQAARLGGQKMAVSPTIASGSSFDVKDHLIKGLIKTSDLSNGKTFMSLSGKQLLVYASDTSIFINGVEVINKAWASGKNDLVHTLNKSLTGSEAAAPGTLTVNVYDATKWSASKPKGELVEGATVDLYLSTDAYKAGDIAYTAQTDASGKAVFNRLFPGTYYMVGHKEGIQLLRSLAVNVISNPDGSKTGFGAESLFQTEQEVTELFSTETPYAYIGNFKPVDVNGDGLINDNDRVVLPYNSAEMESGGTKSADLIIGLEDNHSVLPVTSPIEFARAAESAYYDVFNSYEYWMIIDGVLTDEAVCTTINMNGFPSWVNLCDADHYAYNPANFTGLWSSHYYTLGRINRLIQSAPKVPYVDNIPNQFPVANNDELVAILRTARAVIYGSLLNFYGDAPISESIDLPENAKNSSPEALYNFIKADIDAMMPILADKQTTGMALSADAGRVILARAALHQKKYDVVKTECEELIRGGRYSLLGDVTQLFSDATNAEVIWNRIYGQSANDVPTYFTGRNFVPAMRYSEVLLMEAEALLETGDVAQASQYLNMLCSRRGIAPVSGGSQSELRSKLQEVWKQELYREGSRFSSLIRWGMDESVLGPLGYQAYKGVMPYPTGVLSLYPGIQQHAGY